MTDDEIRAHTEKLFGGDGPGKIYDAGPLGEGFHDTINLGVVEPKILRVPVRQPFFDTEWLDRGMSGVVFFTSSTKFASPERNEGLESQGKQFGLHTNVCSRSGIVARGSQMLVERIVVYPTLEGIRGRQDDYLREVERFRARGEYRVTLGCDLKWGGPLSDILSVGDAPAHKDGDFDPSEAPGLEYRRGIDVRVGDGKLPYVLDDREDFRVHVGGPAVRGEVGLRCYLVGTQLKAVQQ